MRLRERLGKAICEAQELVWDDQEFLTSGNGDPSTKEAFMYEGEQVVWALVEYLNEEADAIEIVQGNLDTSEKICLVVEMIKREIS